LKHIIYCIGISIILLAGSVNGQPLYFRHYQVENGLSHNTVFCSAQDSKGFMWFGTKDGLNRFDGYNFKIYRNKAGDPKSLGSNIINNLLVDRDGILWISTLNGLYTYNSINESFDLIDFTAGKDAGAIKEDQSGDLWMILDNTIFRYEKKTRQHTAYLGNKPGIRGILIDENGNLWVSSEDGLEKYDFAKRSFTLYDLFSHSGIVSARSIEVMCSMGKDSMLVGSHQGLKLFHTKTGIYEDLIRYSADHTDLFVRDIIRNGSDEYWIATESGIYIYHNRTKTFTNLRKDIANPYAISDNAVYALFKDKEGSIWATTYFGGINYCNPENSFFEKFFPNTLAGSLKGSAVREMVQGRNAQELFIGTEDAGLNIFNPNTLQFKPFNSGAADISSTNIHGLLLDGNNLWIGTFDHGIDVIDLNTGRLVKRYLAGSKPGQLRENYVRVIYKTRLGQILIATPTGLYKYDAARGEFNLMSEFGHGIFVNAVFEDDKGTIWAASGGGLYFFNPSSNIKGHYFYNARDTTSISNNTINSIFEDSRHQLWFTTEAGLNKYLPNSKTFARYTVKEGFPSNYMFKILEDNQGFLWITTTKGLVRFNSSTGKLTVYSTANGLLSDQFNYNSAFKDQAGRLYFGCIKGLIRFNPSSIPPASTPPNTYIIGFQIDNQEVLINGIHSPLQQSIIDTKKINLSSGQRSISVDFAALSYIAPQSTRYAYKLEGLEKEWTYLNTNRKVYFTKLSPGTYTLKVKAASSTSNWNATETALIITVAPPFYASIWAYIFYLVICSAGIYYGFYNYHAQMQRKGKVKMEKLENEMAREIYQSKIEFFTNITHEIRTPLTLIKAPLEKAMLSENLDDIRKNFALMQKNTDRLLNLTDQLLDFRKIEKQGLKLNFVKANLSSVVAEIYTLFKPYTEGRLANYILILPPAAIYAYIDLEAFHKILSNLINNAVKYAVNFVQIELRDLPADAASFTVEIKNDGALIPLAVHEDIFKPFFRMGETDHKGTGLGLPLAKSLTEIHNGTITVIPDNRFNVFALSLPVHQAIEFDLFDKETLPETVLQSERDQADQPNGQPTILLVEDQLDIQDFIADGLAEKYNVLTAVNGSQAIVILNEHTIDLVISDIMMPVMDGLELCGLIKNDMQYSHIPIILLTAKNTLQSKIEGLEQGADAYIEKPFSPGHLDVQIKNLLLNRAKVMAHFAETPEASMVTLGHSAADKKFLEVLNNAIVTHMQNVDFDIDRLADVMNMGRRTLFRKIKAISSLTPNELISLARLKKAADLMLQDDYRIYEISDLIGFNSAKVFSRAFQKQFGQSPSEYVKKMRG
jgi:ligand-binding sensor domain-containing protein/signal transduction histidine kinase/DNA-binding response OmpR family regulator